MLFLLKYLSFKKGYLLLTKFRNILSIEAPQVQVDGPDLQQPQNPKHQKHIKIY